MKFYKYKYKSSPIPSQTSFLPHVKLLHTTAGCLCRCCISGCIFKRRPIWTKTCCLELIERNLAVLVFIHLCNDVVPTYVKVAHARQFGGFFRRNESVAITVKTIK